MQLAALVCLLSSVGAFRAMAPRTKALRLCKVYGDSSGSGQNEADAIKHTLVLIRHGESTWNEENKFTGWYDCPLSEKGKKEAESAGKLLKENDFKFDIAYSSFLQRAIRTCWYCLEETGQMHIPLKTAWNLNERHYGSLQGLDKKATVEKYGSDQVNVWRRSYDIPPPDCESDSAMLPANDPKYKSVEGANIIKAESLATTLERVLPYWHSEIVPSIQSGKNVLIAAHGNSLRALVKYLDNIPEDVIAELNIPTGVPLVYHLDKDLKVIAHGNAIAPLQGSYIGNQDDIRARIEGVKAQTGPK
jgi:2,3-bisphosphoglycerate-dependent phosphoglycerate mutase